MMTQHIFTKDIQPIMTTHQLHQIIKINNTAVAMIKKDRYGLAMERFSKAIKILKNEELLNSRTNRTSKCHKVSIDQCMIQNEASGQRTDETNYMYRHGIPLSLDVDETSTIAAVIVFNLGLSHQLMAERTQNMERRNLLTLEASRFYQIAYGTQGNLDPTSNSLFVFATMNNLGLTKTALNAKEEAKQIFEWMLSTHMLLLNTATYRDHMHQVDGFLSNIDDRRPSAAAA